MATESKRCLVLGVNGQDGSYIADHLLARGWIVCGVGRQPNSLWRRDSGRFTYQPLDLSDSVALSALLRDACPSAIFHLAAIHGSAGFAYEDHWAEAHYVNTVSAHAILEYLRRSCQKGVMAYTSSAKAFGASPPLRVSETSRRYSTCIYSITKNAATDLIGYYRTRHGIQASVVWTFNHESPRRATSYFIPKIVTILAQSILDATYQGNIGTLRFWSDWGDANEYMDIVADIAEQAPGHDFVLGTGTTLWAKTFVDDLFLRYGRQAERHILEIIDPPPTKPRRWRADISKLHSMLGRTPQRTAHDVCAEILKLNHPDAWAAIANK